MTNYKWPLTLILSLLLGCSDNEPASAPQPQANAPTQTATTPVAEDENTRFDTLKEEFLEARWELFPQSALFVGLYDYADELTVPDADYRAAVASYVVAWSESLDAIDEAALTIGNRIDYRLLRDHLERLRWSNEVLRDWSWDPSNYNVASGFGLILNTDYAPMAERLADFYQRMATIPAYYEAARANLEAVSEPHLQLAIQQNQGAVGVFDQTFRDAVNAEPSLNDDQRVSYLNRADASIAAINSYVATLEDIASNTTLPVRSFRIGAELFEAKFQREIVSSYSAAEIYKKAVDYKTMLHAEMAAITDDLWATYFPDTDQPDDSLTAIRMMIDVIAMDHVERDEFVDSVRAQIPELEAFVLEHDLLDMDPSRPLVVRETPEYQRGVAGASVNAPGPYDATANTYYNVTPLDAYNDEQAESYLREYNSRTMQILNIHEAVPGHYTQLVHANKTPSRIKRLFGNGAMVEGWAVYTEKMMLEAGYGNGEPELTLMYDKWILRTVMNTIIDYEIHVNAASEDEILEMLMREAFQETAEATGKWRRATLSQVQLSSYFTGFMEIYELREALREQQGEAFDLKDFHNQFLSYGNAPVKYIRELMQVMQVMQVMQDSATN